jgi:hypothetical protein
VDVGGGMRFDDPASAPASSTTSSPSVKRLSSSAGGIGGLAAALALTRKGLRVAVLEQASRFGEVGAGMQIAPDCTRILAEAGLLDGVRELGVLPQRIVIQDAVDGSVRRSLDLQDGSAATDTPTLSSTATTCAERCSGPASAPVSPGDRSTSYGVFAERGRGGRCPQPRRRDHRAGPDRR